VDPYVAVGSAGAVALIAGAAVAAWRGSTRREAIHAADVGPALLVFVGANTITTAAKVAQLLVRDRIKIAGSGVYDSLSTDELMFFFAGVLAAVIIGLLTIRDGWGEIARGAG
jgi:hypothetical protein